MCGESETQQILSEENTMAEEHVLRMKGITKAFPGVVALKGVDFDLKRGELHALVGENGAGKSTLMKILGGAYLPDQGSIEIGGKLVHIHTPKDSLKQKISIIYQEFNLVPTLSVAENIFLGKEMVKGAMKNLNRKAMAEAACSILSRLGLKDLDCLSLVKKLSVAQQQMVEIGKALFNKAEILVMDEPTSVLSQKESEALFQIIDGLKQGGISIVFISHRLDEVLKLSDRITVLRDGELVCTLDNGTKQITKDDLVKHMVGRVLNDYFPARKSVPGEKVFEVKNLSSAGNFRDIRFELRSGEILGFYGLVGSGRTEIMKAIFSSLEFDSGEFLLEGQSVRFSNVQDAKNHGIALIPEDRKKEGLVLQMTMADNVCLPSLKLVAKAGTVIKKKKKNLVESYIEKLSIRPPLPNRSASDFSGGNQQKVVIAKWLATKPKLIIFDEPTRGIDVGAKAEIYQIIEQLAEEGVAVIFISSELMEILGMCDRVIVIHEGTITGQFFRSEATQEKLMQAAAGF